MMADDLLVDPDALREQVRDKYREVAADPHRTFHFHTGRRLAALLGYEAAAVDALPDRAVESFAGWATLLAAPSRARRASGRCRLGGRVRQLPRRLAGR